MSVNVIYILLFSTARIKFKKSTFSSCVFFPSLHRNQTGSAEISEICAANHEATSQRTGPVGLLVQQLTLFWPKVSKYHFQR